jgi:hypothetical protein
LAGLEAGNESLVGVRVRKSFQKRNGYHSLESDVCLDVVVVIDVTIRLLAVLPKDNIEGTKTNIDHQPENLSRKWCMVNHKQVRLDLSAVQMQA